MRTQVLSTVSTVIVVLATITVPACAASPDDKPITQDTIAALQTRISQAQPREQYFLYVELMHQMTEFSVQQYAAGNVEKANGLLNEVQLIAHKIHQSVGEDNKRLKNAEILLRHTAFRLKEMLHNSSFEDRPLLEQTLAQVNLAQNETMLQVFRK
jgi:hypothetical protein